MRLVSIPGLSPRMRGSRMMTDAPERIRGPIPAYAGEPGVLLAAGRVDWAYPRVCGGANEYTMDDLVSVGLSPRMRGSHLIHAGKTFAEGPIPAYAGEPKQQICAGQFLWAYPRVCGGAWHGNNWSAPTHGLSPRMRGSRYGGVGHRNCAGPIPAYAGEPLPDVITNQP